MNRVKEANIKIPTYCFFDVMINMKNLDPNKINVD